MMAKIFEDEIGGEHGVVELSAHSTGEIYIATVDPNERCDYQLINLTPKNVDELIESLQKLKRRISDVV
jgi:hypothetical protein